MSKGNGVKSVGNGKYVFEYFPSEYLELNREICLQPHPKLRELLARHGADEIDIKLAQVAAYCEVVLDDCYDFESRMRLCKILRERLILLREKEPNSIILLS
jgi:hypothetical protein